MGTAVTAPATGDRGQRSCSAKLSGERSRQLARAYTSAVDQRPDVIEGRAVCRAFNEGLPPLKDRIVLVGYNASGLNDAKPTPVDAAMPGVEVLAEATAALVAGRAIWMPPTGLKYLLAAFLVLLPCFAFFRGEPANDID